MVERKFRIDVGWNIAGLGLVAVGGLALNFLIAARYGPGTLGAFNQVFATYIFFSQVAVMGIHFSVLRQVADTRRSAEGRAEVVASAFLLCAVTSAITTSLMAYSAWLVARLLDSHAVRIGLYWAAPGLFLFGLNKVILAVLNATRSMKLFAAAQGLRPLAMIGGLFVLELGDLNPDALPVVLTMSEVVVFLVFGAELVRRGFFHAIPSWKWIRVHASFGGRSFLSGITGELNTRVDVLVLGYFLSDERVGVYSLAAIFAEGLHQLAVVLRNNYNPLLVQKITQGARDLESFLRDGRRSSYLFMLTLTGMSIVAFPILTRTILAEGFSESWGLYTILALGIAAVGGYLPFSGLLLQAGRPVAYTTLRTTTMLINLAGNVVLIPLWGLTGAAIATGAAFVAAGLLIRSSARLLLNVRF